MAGPEELPVSNARAQFSELINRVAYGKEHILLTRHGKPLVALVPAEDLRTETPESSAEPMILDLSSHQAMHAAPLDVAAEHRASPPRAED